MLATDTGQRAEQAAAEYLKRLGYQILDRNWKLHKVCEIDIVAQKGSTVHFVEVKYRRTNIAGAGLEYITAEKLKRMRLGAVKWASMHGWHRGYELSAIEVTGPEFSVTDFIPAI